MPVKSYLAYPQDGMKSRLVSDLSKIEYCEILPAQNKEILVLVTDTNDEIEEKNLEEKLKSVESLKGLAMVSGFDT